MVPATRYAQSDGVSIAYETPGHRPNDLVLVPGWVSNLDNHWEQPAVGNFYRRLASLSRLILFDKPYLDAGETAVRTRINVGHLDATQMGNRWLRIPRCVKSSGVTFVSRRAQPM